MTRPALWFLHGLGSGRVSWAAVLAQPVLAPFTTVADDLPGHGARRDEWRGPIEGIAEAVAARVSRADGSVVLVGHSLGGAIATLAAEHRPARLAGVVNVEGNLTLADCTISGAAAAATDFGAWWRHVLAQLARSEPAYGRTLEETDPQAFLSLSRDLVRLSTDAGIGKRYARLPVPRLYVHGDTLPRDSTRLLAAEGLDRHVIRGAGHWVMGDRPVETARVIAAVAGGWTGDPTSTRVASRP